MSQLQNKVAVITGGNSGIGFAAAQDFVTKGARVLITGRNPQAVDQAVAALGERAAGIIADQGSVRDAEKLAAHISAQYGKVDILFVNAGVGRFSAIADADEAHFDEIMNINFKGAFFTAQKLLPLVNDGGTIIFLSSINAYVGMPGAGVYSASKAALNSVARTLSRELAPRNIRVNVINPGPIDTAILDKAGQTADTKKEFQATLRRNVPLQRIGEAGEVAKLTSFLASDDALFINGAEINIDGGLMVHPLLSQS
jgi:NAD(P)-dependent dehydrogenase (short-subunit alcohol dehydrogenase family)